MTSNDELKQIALSHFSTGFNCAQSTFGALAEKIDLEPTIALKTATPFGGGISHNGSICGTVSGALMGLGYHFGNTTPDSAVKYRNYEIGSLFLEKFRAQFGEVTCPGLLGLDIRIPEELAKVRELDLFNQRCCQFISGAVEIAVQLIDELN